MSDLNHIYLSTIHAWDDNEVKATDVIKWIMMFLVRELHEGFVKLWFLLCNLHVYSFLCL